MSARRVVAGAATIAALASLVVSFRGRDASKTAEPPPTSAAKVDPTASTAARAPTDRGVASPELPTRAPKPVTEGQQALTESKIPALAALSIDRQGSPREWLSSTARPDRASRDAQLGTLSTRARAHLNALRDRRAASTDPVERARLDDAIRTIERNEAERSAIVSRTVRDESRPFAERAR
ncbi:MAG TPA: hypothetical protein VHE30_13895 [Polyangiaceae bacterium]|nr:hypothetical protein [Polyangiaceae bacterium]